MSERRRLAAIVAADVVGYSRLMGRDEAGTLAALNAVRRDIVDPLIATHGGRIVKTTGDGLLLEFPSVVDAVRCVVAVQGAMAEHGATVAEERRIAMRIGVHLGDIIVEGDDIFGDGVNIAARLEGIAEPGGACLSDDAYRQILGKVEAAFDNLGPQTLKNIVQPVTAWRLRVTGAAATTSPTPRLALPDKPSIAVLPFQNMSGDPEQEYFADGVSEDIITELSRFRDLFVIARNSAFTYRGKAVDVRQVARELGVRHVLEGSVRKAGNRVRVTAQLIDAETGAHLWAERYDRDLQDIFALQEEITRTIVGSIAPAIEESALARIRRVPPGNLSAYDIAMRAWSEASAAYMSGDPALRDRAAASARRALDLDADCVRAWVTLAFVFWQSEFYAGRDSTAETCRPALDAARRALELDRNEHRAYMIRGLLNVRLGRYDDGLADLRRACDMNPNDALALNGLGYGEVMNGDGLAAKAHLQQALRLSPRDPQRFNACVALANACFLTGEYAEGLGWIDECRRDHPNFPPALSVGIKLHVGLGEIDQARAEVALLRRVSPAAAERASAGRSVLRRPEDREREIRYFRLAFAPPAETGAPALSLPDKPSIAVLPFTNMSGDPEQEYFADGMTEDILTALSRFRGLFVIARNSSFTYKGRAVDIKRVGAELGVRYVLEGSVRSAGGRIRVTAQLIEAATGHHVWAERYDRRVDDIFDVQDEVTARIVSAIDFEVGAVEARRPQRATGADLGVWSAYHRGFPLLFRPVKEGNRVAREVFDGLIASHPDFAPAYAASAFARTSDWMYEWDGDRSACVDQAIEYGRKAIELDDGDAFAHLTLGRALLVARERDLGVAEIEKGVARNANLGVAHYLLGVGYMSLGRAREAIASLDMAARLSPRDMLLWAHFMFRAMCQSFLGEHDHAIDSARRSIAERPDMFMSYIALAFALLDSGRVEEARESLAKALERRPDLSATTRMLQMPFVPDAYIAEGLEKLRRLGLPE